MRRLALLRGLLILLTLTCAISWSTRADAYAWMIKHGFSECVSCHTDPSGGETLTGFGRVQSQYLLSAGGEDAGLPSSGAQFLFGLVDEPDDVHLGGSYRHLVIYTGGNREVASTLTHFPMQADVYGAARFGPFMLSASLGVARGIEGTAHVRGAQLNTEAGDGFIVLSRSHWLGLWLQEDALLRVGRLNLPFGIRIPEHVMWTREATRTDRESDQQHGASLVYSGGRWRTEAMLIIGNFQLNPDRYRERGLAATVEYLLTPTFAVGGSGILTRAEEDAFTRVRQSIRYAYGVNARWGLSPQASLLAELDVLEEDGRKPGYTGFAQADYEPLRGLHLMLTGEVLDQGLLDREGAAALSGAGRARYGAWATLDWYPLPHLELRFDGVFRQGDVFQGQAQLHLYF